MSDKVEISAIANGPFKVSNLKTLEYCGQKTEISGDTYICRCGESKKAPYCDGSHSKVDFKGENDGVYNHDMVEWQGKKIKTYFNPNICMHAYKCKNGDLRKSEPEDGTQKSATEIADIVQSYPSGALTFELMEDIATNDKQDLPHKLSLIKVRFRFTAICLGKLRTSKRQPTNRVTLCRCGLSKNKPYCDANHEKKKVCLNTLADSTFVDLINLLWKYWWCSSIITTEFQIPIEV